MPCLLDLGLTSMAGNYSSSALALDMSSIMEFFSSIPTGSMNLKQSIYFLNVFRFNSFHKKIYSF